ncbi:MAG: hypothetical protein WED85_04835, partial [Dehalococcoidia bacterium]
MAHSTLDDLVTQIRDYRPSDVLTRVRTLSDAIKKADPPGLVIELPPELRYGGMEQSLLVAMYLPALIARLSLLVGHELAPGTLDETRFLRLLRIGCDLYDPRAYDDPW